ncbi:MAG: M28 family peptidase [Armatimonadetes bacterium]|nr:M28 family peptidase [Armatimonadota bacterium]
MLDTGQVSADRLMQYTRTISQWARHAGTPEELEAARYIEREFTALGYATRLILHDAYVSLPGEAALVLVEPRRQEIPCVANAFGLPTGPDGVAVEVVDAGKGTASEFAAAGAAGKVALVEGRSRPHHAVHAGKVGAKGIICMNGRYAHQSGSSPVWGSPGESNVAQLPRLHILSVSLTDGEGLRALCRQGPVRVHFTTRVQTGWTKTPIVVADLAPGHAEAEPEKYVLFAAHADSWYHGAMDNGSANAAMLELARLAAGQRGGMRRGLRYAVWSGHSQGRYSSSAWYADQFWSDLDENCVAHLNVDSLGALDCDVFRTNSMPETAGLGKWAVKEVAGAVLDAQRAGRNSDQSFMGIGIPMLFGYIAVQREGWLGWWWHTSHDTVDKIDPDRLVRDTRIVGLVLGRLLGDPVLPLDYAASAADIRTNLEDLARAAEGKFDLSSTINLAGTLERLCRRLPEAAVSPRAINACLQDLGRILISATYTIAGRFIPDPAYEVPFLPKLQGVRRLGPLDPDSDQAKFLMVDLARARNELVEALRRACRRVEDVLPAGKGG